MCQNCRRRPATWRLYTGYKLPTRFQTIQQYRSTLSNRFYYSILRRNMTSPTFIGAVINSWKGSRNGDKVRKCRLSPSLYSINSVVVTHVPRFFEWPTGQVLSAVGGPAADTEVRGAHDRWPTGSSIGGVIASLRVASRYPMSWRQRPPTALTMSSARHGQTPPSRHIITLLDGHRGHPDVQYQVSDVSPPAAHLA